MLVLRNSWIEMDMIPESGSGSFCLLDHRREGSEGHGSLMVTNVPLCVCPGVTLIKTSNERDGRRQHNASQGESQLIHHSQDLRPSRLPFANTMSAPLRSMPLTETFPSHHSLSPHYQAYSSDFPSSSQRTADEPVQAHGLSPHRA